MTDPEQLRRRNRGSAAKPWHRRRAQPGDDDEVGATDAGHQLALAAARAAVGRDEGRRVPRQPAPQLRRRRRSRDVHERRLGHPGHSRRALRAPVPAYVRRHGRADRLGRQVQAAGAEGRRRDRREGRSGRPDRAHRPRQGQQDHDRQVRRRGGRRRLGRRRPLQLPGDPRVTTTTGASPPRRSRRAPS